MWAVYGILASIFTSVKDVAGKSVVKNTDEYIAAFALQFFASLAILPLIVVFGIPQIKPEFMLATLGTLVTIPLWSLLYMKAIRLSSLSLSLPMLAFNPVLTALLSIVFEHKLPGIWGWLGIVLVGAGIYFIYSRGRKLGSLAAPLVLLWKEPGARLMLVIALIWSLGSHLAKVGSLASSPLFFAFTVTFLGSLVLLAVLKLKGGDNFLMLKKNLWGFLSLGAFHGLSEVFFFAGFSVGFVPYVVSLKRLSIAWSSILGGVVFKEEITRKTLVGLGLMGVGVVTIILS